MHPPHRSAIHTVTATRRKSSSPDRHSADPHPPPLGNRRLHHAPHGRAFFLFMYYLNIPSNIMSLCGIAISIGICRWAVVMVEKRLARAKLHFGNQKSRRHQ
jgi:hypothetical protein